MGTTLLILSVIVLLVAILAATIRDIHDDGYGRRPGPPSHHPDRYEPHLRSH
jgi:hypothetical protein